MSAIARKTPNPPEGISVNLCLAGSGFRASMFHAGALCRLNELGLLASLSQIHAVAGGAVSAGILVDRWGMLPQDSHGRFLDFEEAVLRPMERLVSRHWRFEPTLRSRMRPGNWIKLATHSFTETDRLVEMMDERVFSGRRLVDLKGRVPHATWHATNLRTGGSFEISAARVGEAGTGFRFPARVRLSEAVVGSVVPPEQLPPLKLFSRSSEFDAHPTDPEDEKLQEVAFLCDGSSHDPLAVESALRQPGLLLVCDGGSVLLPDPDYEDWTGNRMLRTLAIQRHRAVEMRRQWIVQTIRSGRLEGAYIALAAHHADYGLRDSMGLTPGAARKLFGFRDGVETISQEVASLLVNHGYTIADAAVRRLMPHRIATLTPLKVPYPDADGGRLVARLPKRKAG